MIQVKISDNQLHLPTNSGSYSLIIKLKRTRKITVGRLGLVVFPRGYYVYTGRARKGLLARLLRHQQLSKKRHWHVDYLTSCPEASVTDILIFPDERQEECYVNQSILKLREASIIVIKFGSSDCIEGCPTHLIYFGNRSPLVEIKNLFPD